MTQEDLSDLRAKKGPAIFGIHFSLYSGERARQKFAKFCTKKNCKIRANFAVGRRALLRARGEAHPGARGRPRRGPGAHRRRDGQDADAGARRVLLRVGHKEANELFTLENE